MVRAATLRRHRMQPAQVTTNPDVQASAPTLHVSLSRVGVTGVEKVIRIGPPGEEQLFSARLECFVDLGPRQKGAHMSRFEEVVNDAIGEVILGESGFKAETLAQRIAERVRERQDALRAEVTIAARYPEHKPAPVSGIPTQEIYTLYGSAVASARGHAPPRRRRRAGHDGLPVRAAARRRPRARAPGRRGLLRRRDRAHPRRRPGRDAQPARPGDAAHRLPRGLHDRDRGDDAARDRRGLDVERDLRADEALRRGRRRREGPPPPALRRGLRARDDPRRRRAPRRAARRRRSSPPARRTSRRSTSTTSSPSASGCSASCATRSPRASTSRITPPCASGSTRRGGA